jgi:hypothetical protein
VNLQPIKFKIVRLKPRKSFLYTDGQYKPKQEKSAKAFRRHDKHRRENGDWF